MTKRTKTKAAAEPKDGRIAAARMTPELESALDAATARIQKERPEETVRRSDAVRILLGEALRGRGLLKTA